jgi:MscS family membrane protein
MPPDLTWIDWIKQNPALLGVSLSTWVKILASLIIGKTLGWLIQKPLIKQIQRISPKIDRQISVRIGKTIEWSIFFLFLIIVVKATGALESLQLSVLAFERSNALINFCIFVIAGWLLGRLLRYPIAYWLEKITPDTDHTTSVRVGRAIEWSTFFLVFSLVMKSGGIDVLKLPGWLWEKTHFGVTILISLSSTILMLQVIEIVLLGLQKRWASTQDGVDDSLINFLRKGARIFLIIIMTLITADNIGFKVTGAIAGLGIGGAAVALAAQGLIANLLGTIEVVADKLYRVGDRIHFEEFDGFVLDVGLRSTRIRALTGEEIRVPNKKMAEVQIRNYSRHGSVRTSVVVGITYSTTHDQIRQSMQILDEIFKSRKDVESFQIYLKNLGSYSLDLEVIFWAKYDKSADYNRIIGEVHLEVKKRFDEAKIEFAFPTQTLYVANPTPPVTPGR